MLSDEANSKLSQDRSQAVDQQKPRRPVLTALLQAHQVVAHLQRMQASSHGRRAECVARLISAQTSIYRSLERLATSECEPAGGGR